MRRWAIVIMGGLAACSSGGGGKDACERAFDKLQALGVFGGDTYGAEEATALGLGCKELTKDDLACIDKAKAQADLDACDHVSKVSTEKLELLEGSVTGGKPADPAAIGAWADAACACKDTGCLVGVAEKQQAQIEAILKASEPDDPKARDAAQRMRQCVDKLPAPGGGAPANGVPSAGHADAKVDAERMALRDIATVDYSQWQVENGGQCPAALADLTKNIRDAWGNERRFVCGDPVPFGVVSNGPDGQPGTADDLHSW